MEFKEETLKDFKCIGIAARVTPRTAAELIGGLWQRWFKEGLESKIPNKISGDKYNIYTNYEGDHTKPYTCFLGVLVNSIDNVPDGMQALDVLGGKYAVFDVSGKLPDAVVETWTSIYQLKTIERRFDTDFDVYGEEAANPENAKLKTYVSVK